tara:strand:+ start:904 stop:1167 length:264 start_codon:yes stop_codon:yes gene_type:complete
LDIGDIMRGYSQLVIELNEGANKTLDIKIGALLGKACIESRYPVTTVANELNVSRQTVYDWFSGKAIPTKSKRDMINNLIQQINKSV